VSAPVEAYFAEWLRTARAEAGMSQRMVAEVLRAQGFAVFRQSTIGKIEAGSRPVLLTEAVAMAELFGTTLDVALGLKPMAPRVPSERETRQAALLHRLASSIEAELGGDA